MKNIEFAEKHGITYNPRSNKIGLLDLYPYQNNILNDLEKNRFIAIQHSRQMGLTTMLLFHITNFLIHNTNGNNLLCFKSPNTNYSRDMINKVRNLLTNYRINNSITYIKSNQTSIKLNNGNEFRIITDINSLNLPDKNIDKSLQLDKDSPYALIVDNAAWVKNVDRIVEDFIEIGITQIILVSGKITTPNKFYDKFFTSDNAFLKKNIHWRLNPTFTDEWYEEMKRNFKDDLDSFKCEVDLIDITPKIKENKDKIINVRLDDESMNKLSLKLIANDLSLSEYIRVLIKKDI